MQSGSGLKNFPGCCHFVKSMTYFCSRLAFLSTFFRSIESMSPCKPAIQKLTLTLFSVVFSVIYVLGQDGQAIFRSKCASCHIMGKDATGPNLQGVIGKWGGDVEALHVWVNNWSKAVAAGYPRAKEIVSFSGSAMQVFEGAMTPADIDAVLKYVDTWQPPVVDKDDQNAPGASGGQD